MRECLQNGELQQSGHLANVEPWRLPVFFTMDDLGKHERGDQKWSDKKSN